MTVFCCKIPFLWQDSHKKYMSGFKYRNYILNDSEGYQHRHHNKNLLLVHLIFVTKYRKPVFSSKLKHDVKQYVFDVCKQNHWYIKAMETDSSHIHILLQYDPTDSISNIVSILKQYTTHLMWKDHNSTLKQHYWEQQRLWSGGYFACSIGNASAKTIQDYINNQG